MVKPHELIVDLFAGGGGASQGIFQALGRHPDIAVNHDDDAVAVHARNHPETDHRCVSVWKAEPRELCAGRPVGLLWASPDCFPAGTLVLTDGGQKPIEVVEAGDLVLTHRGRWRAVTSTMTREAETVEVRGHGHYGMVTTPRHLFYSKRITTRYPTDRKENGCRVAPKRTVENPYWPAAEDMADKLWATPRAFPVSQIPMCEGAEFSADFFYLMGRWIGDGSINKGDVEICCGLKESEGFETLLRNSPLINADGQQVHHRLVDHGSSLLFVWGNAPLARWLAEQVGTSCETKRLPVWCLSMQHAWRRALLCGYVDADGWEGIRTETKSVSKALSVGIRLLAVSLGHAAALYRQAGRSGSIEGRSYIGHDTYSVAWRDEQERETVFRDTLHQFSPVREVTPAGMRTVISLQVEEDESFVADGIVVHNCRHFSRAAGGQPKWGKIRSLPGVVITWATRVRPRVICVENVREMLGWGPLLADGTPCPDRIGRSFNQWVGRLRGLGYKVQWREFCAADYGVPTIRTRLFVQARCDGEPIVWPQPTHAKVPGMFAERPWRAASECIDWSIPCPSIFTRRRPLKDATMRRIARGMQRYVIGTPDPFIVRIGHWSHKTGGGFGLRGQSVDDPLTTTTTVRDKALVVPHVSSFYGNSVGSGADQPLGAITAHGEHQGLVSAVLAGCGGRAGQSPERPVTAPFGTMTTKADQILVAASLAPITHTGENRGSSLADPVPTLTCAHRGEQAVVAAFLAQHNLGAVGSKASAPMSTITSTGSQQALVEAKLSDADRAGAERVAAFLVHYFGHGKQGQDLREPLGVGGTHGRFALVMVRGVPTPIVDIGMRMLAPHELAAAQGFTSDYDLTDLGRLTKTATIRLIGNSVCPGVAEAVVRAAFRAPARKAVAA
jgi:site-specific DNA-cytosine methylase